MAVTTTNSAYILKRLWPQKRVENLVYQDHPFLAMVPKATDFYGADLVLAVRTADSQGRSAAFATAQANVGNHQGARFILTRASDYQIVSLTTEAILAAKNDRGALVRNLDTEMDSGMNNISKSLATALYRGQSGYIGQVHPTTAITATTVTLSNANDVTSFEVGMKLVASATKTGANRATPATATITGVDRDLGVLTFAGGTFAGTNWAASDFIFAQGDNANGAGSGNKVTGLEDWLPDTAPTGGDSFFSQDRSSDPTRLAGLRIDVSGLNPEEGVVTVFSRQAREGGRPTYFFVNHLDFRNIEISLGSKVVYEEQSVGEIGFTALKVMGPKGPVAIMADQDCRSGHGYSIDMRSVKLYSLEDCPMILDLDGNKLSREASNDRWEARIAYFANLGFTAPGWNANATLPS
jgi:hypothetical protein